ncbi:enhancer of polycomb homolog 1-like isoform X1 [Metopolophium dirhodum]|uniref:enhancer of polycomb homolog 1-like isoform X1 n=1 Tax=Metopolophium dirhodum TaxID=44670 RepID=UPI00298FF32D|nr:enhancer of polycomb homolog 1-like isoform X1 [Metopolophium dirhodum]
MRNTGNLLKWTQNSTNKSAKGGGENRNWIHPPEALQKGHIAYIVKFLGNVDVDQPKGFKVIKESIQKLKFNQQVRKAEGSKVPKVELTISVEGVALQDPKTKVIMHQYPLHRISYCADDKVDKQFFSFIVKDSNESERHTCFVFMSDKLAEEITLSIGQAFDLAYKWPSKPTNKPTFRARQLDVSKPLPIYMSDDLPDLHECMELKRAVPQMPSGMEKEEESEHHLQRAMVAGSVIPTPEVAKLINNDLKWHDQTYPPDCHPPKQLIHITPFTMEQDVPEYDYDSEDLEWLNTTGRSNSITADKLEELVDKWEKHSTYNIIDLSDAKALTKDDEDTILLIYDYWLRKRVRVGHTLSPAVRTEPIAGAPPNDSYVAFRKRRDKIQTRKNRKNDEASYEKMLKLRRNLARAFDLIGTIQHRETLKKQLVQLTLDTYQKRFDLRDFNGNIYKDVELVKTVRHAFTPISTNHYMSAMWKQCDMKKSSANAKYQDAKREKRHYRKRKHKSYDVDHLSSDEEMYSPPHKSQNVDDGGGKWSFRRNKHCSYLAPLNSPEPVDPTFGFQPVYIQKNKNHKSLGLCRPRYGRGGRIVLDRYTNDDDRWASLDYNIIEQKQYEMVEFKRYSDNEMSDYFSDADIDCPIMEINSEIQRDKTRIELNWDNFGPEIFQGVADICKVEYDEMNKEKNEQGESILERWVNQNQPHAVEPTLALGSDSEVVGCSQFRTTDLSEPRRLRSTNCLSLKRLLKCDTDSH